MSAAALLVAQLASALLLLYVGLPMNGVRDSQGNLTRRGRLCLIIGALSLVASVIGDTVAAQRSESLLHQKIDALFKRISGLVMEVQARASFQPAAEPASGELTILEPVDGSSAGHQQLVSGTVENPRASVWLIVHPLGTGAFWVQPEVTVSRSGHWKAQAYFGRAGKLDAGGRFELMAVAYPAVPPDQGKTLPGWPEAGWRSQVVTIIRAAD